MRVVKLVSSLSPEGRAYARGFKHSAIAIVVVIVSSIYPTTASATTSLRVPESEMFQTDTAALSDRTVCLGGKSIPRDVSKERGVEEALDEAIRLLQTCPACKEFFAKDKDPVSRLKELRDEGAIIVSKKYPLDPEQVGLKKYVFKEFAKMGNLTYITIVDLENRPSGEYGRPCIYVNPDSYLVKDTPIVNPDSALYGLSLVEARAISILHELGHIADVIPPDRIYKGGKFVPDGNVSEANTRCVRANCIPCADSSVACPKPQARPSSRKHGRPFKPKRLSSIFNRIGSDRVARLGLEL